MKRFKKTAGFTLVELIVVIAIMAILAGVGTVGYGAYIKSSNKKADQVLVGNYIRTIETAGNSYMTQYEGVEQAAAVGAQLPIGFVIINDTGTTCLYADEDSCLFTAYDYACSEAKRTNSWGKKYYELTNATPNVEVCTKHTTSKGDPLIDQTIKLKDKFSTENEKDVFVYQGPLFTRDTCPGGTTESGVIDEALIAAYGDSYKDNALKSNEWSLSSIPTFWTNATNLWSNVQNLTNLMYKMTSITGGVGNKISELAGIGKYNSPADIVYAVANNISQKEESAFVKDWCGADTDTPDYNFKMSGGREFYTAVRASYNSCFASYLKQEGHTEHITQVENYGETAGTLIKDKLPSSMSWAGSMVDGIVGDTKFSKTICTKSFADENGNIDATFKEYGPDIWNCSECKRLYKEYIDNGIDAVNGKAVYETMVTAASTPYAEGGQITNDNSNNFFSDYNKYLAKFETLYTGVNNMVGENAIVISVYYNEDGTLGYDVSPTEANPRKE